MASLPAHIFSQANSRRHTLFSETFYCRCLNVQVKVSTSGGGVVETNNISRVFDVGTSGRLATHSIKIASVVTCHRLDVRAGTLHPAEPSVGLRQKGGDWTLLECTNCSTKCFAVPSNSRRILVGKTMVRGLQVDHIKADENFSSVFGVVIRPDPALSMAPSDVEGESSFQAKCTSVVNEKQREMQMRIREFQMAQRLEFQRFSDRVKTEANILQQRETKMKLGGLTSYKDVFLEKSPQDTQPPSAEMTEDVPETDVLAGALPSPARSAQSSPVGTQLRATKAADISDLQAADGSIGIPATGRRRPARPADSSDDEKSDEDVAERHALADTLVQDADEDESQMFFFSEQLEVIEHNPTMLKPYITEELPEDEPPPARRTRSHKERLVAASLPIQIPAYSRSQLPFLKSVDEDHGFGAGAHADLGIGSIPEEDQWHSLVPGQRGSNVSVGSGRSERQSVSSSEPD